LFKYYTTAQLAIVAPGRAPRPVGRPAMYLDFWVSPDGRHILRETLEDPLSYLVAFNSFGKRLDVIDLEVARSRDPLRREPHPQALFDLQVGALLLGVVARAGAAAEELRLDLRLDQRSARAASASCWYLL
jgi:hypothetical protein